MGRTRKMWEGRRAKYPRELMSPASLGTQFRWLDFQSTQGMEAMPFVYRHVRLGHLPGTLFARAVAIDIVTDRWWINRP